MKRILLTTAAVFALTGMAHSQTVNANSGSALSTTGTEKASATSSSEIAIARTKWNNTLSSRAKVGNNVVAKAEGDDLNGTTGSVDVGTGNVNNASGILQIGTTNAAVNMQVGNYQESAMLQIGEGNSGLISQTYSANEAAMAQVGDRNTSVLVQNGNDNAAAATAWGDDNFALGLQEGGAQNVLAIAQEHDNNSAVAMQDGDHNTIATVQDGNDNVSFISQGAGTSFSMLDIAGDPHSATLTSPAILGSITSMGSSYNSAASLQISDGNLSAIVQTGTGNTAINYQN